MKQIVTIIACLMAVLFLSSAASMAEQTAFQLCTAKSTGNYYKAGNLLKQYTKQIVPITTMGSGDNLKLLNEGKCDGAFVQADAFVTYRDKYPQLISSVRRAAPLYTEYFHLACNKNAGVESITDLGEKPEIKIAVGDADGGTAIMWNSFVTASKAGWFSSKKYQENAVVYKNDYATMAAVDDGTDIQCIAQVSAFGNTQFFKDLASFENIELIPVDDSDILDKVVDKGKPVYIETEIPSGTYPELLPEGSLWGTKGVDTIGVNAIFVINAEFADNNPGLNEAVLRAYKSAGKEIRNLVGQ